MPVNLVIVSHSPTLAAGVVELAGQMAPGISLTPVGGTDDGRLGTSFDRVYDAVAAATEDGCEVAVLTDLGSATMVAESVVECLHTSHAVAIAEGPLVEGAVAGAVAAHSGASLRQVIDAVAGALTSMEKVDTSQTAPMPPARESAPATPRQQHASCELVLQNDVGLHARPAAALSRLASHFNAEIRVNDALASSVLSLMALGLGQGDTMSVSATGEDASAAIEAISALVERDFAPADS
ncbi:MAG: dihydroxyacetone kinase phosphoryl donor subunit DhaM [Bowdeniella nasicola]|nr:dihydroxyacetone kinase phosphoryl donor subunit DhaM [Bowdeniella nasicola]